MARIELRHCTIDLLDGLAGTAIAPVSPPMMGDATLMITSPALNTDVADQVPVGARFTIAGETDPLAVHTVTARTPTSGSTTSITFAPALGAGTYAASAVITFQSQQLTIKVGDGDVKYTENTAYIYDLDRGDLDTVREGNQVPMDLTLNFTYEHITTGTSETISPMDAIKRKNKASEWVSSAADKCEPYAVDVRITHTPPCGTSQKEITLLVDFRSEKREPDFKNSAIAITGKCNAVEPVVSRV